MVNLKEFLKAIDEFENYGIAKEVTIQALKEAFSSLFKKKGYEDTRVDVQIDADAAKIDINLIKTVVEDSREDDLDDNVEITLSEAREINSEVNVGDDLYIKVELDDFKKADALKFKSVFKQKIKEAEKQAVYQAFADKKGELITGVVEKVEPNFTIINIGRTTVTLPNNSKIGDETFSVGDNIKIYLSEINSSSGGPQLMVTRADGGFLKRLFEEEVHEVYTGTVVIKDVARSAGERSKISVYSTNPNVDPIGACIGPAGTKIQKICAQLGREKIDVVQYHEYPGLFIAEALKPAEVIGVSLNEEAHSAIAVVKNDSLRVAIGRKGINVVLAVKLTGWKIDIKEQDVALSEGISYLTMDQMLRKEEEIALEKRRQEILKANEEEKLRLQAQASEEVPLDEVKEEPVEETEKVELEEELKEEKPVEEVKETKEEIPFEEQKVEVNLSQPRVSLADLENQIEQEKNKNKVQPKKKFVKKEEEEEKPQVKEEEKEEAKPSFNAMPIYSDEELEELDEEEEEENSYDDDIDYSDYDKYYEE